MKDVKDGMKEFGCTKHGIDYRKYCDECDVMSEKFSKVLKEHLEEGEK